jgi:hypothetical protein
MNGKRVHELHFCCSLAPGSDAPNFVVERNFRVFSFQILIITWLCALEGAEQQISINHVRQLRAAI